MNRGWLGDGDIALLARQAVDRCVPGLRITFEAVPVMHAPYGADLLPTAQWLVHLGDRRARLALLVDSGMPPYEVVGRVMAALDADADAHGRQVPPCPGHDHAADIHLDRDAEVVVLYCPDSGDEVDRIVPQLRTGVTDQLSARSRWRGTPGPR